MIKPGGVLSQHGQGPLLFLVFGLAPVLRLRDRLEKAQVVTHLAQQQFVLPGRHQQRDRGSEDEQPQGCQSSSQDRCLRYPHWQQLQQLVRKRQRHGVQAAGPLIIGETSPLMQPLTPEVSGHVAGKCRYQLHEASDGQAFGTANRVFATARQNLARQPGRYTAQLHARLQPFTAHQRVEGLSLPLPQGHVRAGMPYTEFLLARLPTEPWLLATTTLDIGGQQHRQDSSLPTRLCQLMAIGTQSSGKRGTVDMLTRVDDQHDAQLGRPVRTLRQYARRHPR
ncbi:hypothetical protein D9M68_460620 [compost metagenome]